MIIYYCLYSLLTDRANVWGSNDPPVCKITSCNSFDILTKFFKEY